MRKINLIIIHCSATRANRNFTVEDLEACHKARGFKTTGYHYYITKDGEIYPCRPEEMIGAHAKHYNAHSIGICYEGGLDANGNPADTRTEAQKRSMIELLKRASASTIQKPKSSGTETSHGSENPVLAMMSRSG